MGNVPFSAVPDVYRLPVVMAEFDSSQAMQGPATMAYKTLVIGPRNGGNAGTMPARVTRVETARELFGPSIVTDMVKTVLENDPVTELWVAGIDDDLAGVAAKATLTLSGTATEAGTMPLYVAGERVRVGVKVGDTAAVVAQALAVVVNAAALPVTAAATAGALTLTARHKGEIGNGLDVRLAAYDEDIIPAGLVSDAAFVPGSPTPCWKMAAGMAAVAAYFGSIDPARPFNTLPILDVLAPRKDGLGVRLAGGTGNPEIAPLLAMLGDVQYQIIATAYTDGVNLRDLKEELAERWGPLRMIEGVAFAAVTGTHGQLCDIGDGHNSPHLCLAHTGGPFTNEENNLLLFNGISAFSYDVDGVVRVKKPITTYKTAASGAADESYLSLNTVLTLSYLRWDWRNRIMRKYPRHKLAMDGTRGANIMTPQKMRVECLAWFDDMDAGGLGLVEDRAAFKSLLIVERDAKNVNRLNVLLPPDLVNGLDIVAAVFQFRL